MTTFELTPALDRTPGYAFIVGGPHAIIGHHLVIGGTDWLFFLNPTADRESGYDFIIGRADDAIVGNHLIIGGTDWLGFFLNPVIE